MKITEWSALSPECIYPVFYVKTDLSRLGPYTKSEARRIVRDMRLRNENVELIRAWSAVQANKLKPIYG